MKSMSLSRRVAAAGAVSAMAAGALVATAGTASADDPVVNNVYSCTVPGFPAFPVGLQAVAVGISGFPSIGAGTSIPAGLLTVSNVFTIPGQVHDLMAQLQVQDVSATSYSGDFGGNPISVSGVSVTLANMTQNGDGTWSSDHVDNDGNGLPDSGEGNGLNDAFEVPAAGTYDVLSPANLTLLATKADGTPAAQVSCVIQDGTTPGAFTNILVTKNASTVAAKATKKHFAQGKAAKVKTTVTGGSKTPTGKVLLKKGSKTLASGSLNDAGQAVLSTKKLPVGKNSLTVVYKG